jgi:hypothetical protein
MANPIMEPIHYKVKQTWPNGAADIQIGKTSLHIHPKMLYMYAIYVK